jgi:hypothetical protein
MGSSLLSLDQQKVIMSWLGESKTCELVYQSTRDGFNPDIFHRLCDDKGPTGIMWEGGKEEKLELWDCYLKFGLTKRFEGVLLKDGCWIVESVRFG